MSEHAKELAARLYEAAADSLPGNVGRYHLLDDAAQELDRLRGELECAAAERDANLRQAVAEATERDRAEARVAALQVALREIREMDDAPPEAQDAEGVANEAMGRLANIRRIV